MYLNFFILFVAVNVLLDILFFADATNSRVMAVDRGRYREAFERQFLRAKFRQKLSVVLLPVAFLAALLWPLEALLGACLGVWGTYRFLRGIVRDARELRKDA